MTRPYFWDDQIKVNSGSIGRCSMPRLSGSKSCWARRHTPSTCLFTSGQRAGFDAMGCSGSTDEGSEEQLREELQDWHGKS